MIEEKTFNNGFPYIEINNAMAEAKIALQGAHVFAYKARNRPALLWLSTKSHFTQGKAIRGGIPLCFPWFGKNTEDETLPQHGFARTALWELAEVEALDDGSTCVRLRLCESRESLAQWNYRFELTLEVHVAESLSVQLQIKNRDTKAFEIGTALHTYLRVSDIEDVKIEGLEGSSYYDALTKRTQVQEGNVKIKEEVDRVYQTKGENIIVRAGVQSINIKSEGSSSVVIWNPWKEKSVSMQDMSDTGYKSMVCVETSNALADRQTLAPGETHNIGALYREEGFNTN